MRICVAYDEAVDQTVEQLTGHDALAVNDADRVVEALHALDHEAWSLGLGQSAAVQLTNVVETKRPELVFNLCDLLCFDHLHAPLVPAMLELLGVECVGANARGVSLLTQKHHVKALLTQAGLPTPRYQVIHDAHHATKFQLELEPPVIVKPTGTHASVGIAQRSVCATEEQVQTQALAALQRRNEPVLIEEYVHGREIYVSVQGDPPTPLKPREYDLGQIPEHWVPIRSSESKWVKEDSKQNLAIEPYVGELEDTPIRQGTVNGPKGTRGLEYRCVEAFRLAGGRDWGRVEMRLDRGGIPLIIDVTSNTYLGAEAACVVAAQADGLNYHQLIERILAGAIARAERRAATTDETKSERVSVP
ncbi:MAG: hypothetical protein AAFP04_12145 [Myxococcota bacterium]